MVVHVGYARKVSKQRRQASWKPSNGVEEEGVRVTSSWDKWVCKDGLPGGGPGSAKRGGSVGGDKSVKGTLKAAGVERKGP